jgi:hypothetical protein
MAEIPGPRSPLANIFELVVKWGFRDSNRVKARSMLSHFPLFPNLKRYKFRPVCPQELVIDYFREIPSWF